MVAALALVFSTLLVAEIIARVVDVRRRKHEYAAEAKSRLELHLPPYAWHPFLGQVHAANYSSPTCVTDKHGFRNRHPVLPHKPAGEFRVLLAGGSTAAGACAPDGQTLRDALQSECERAHRGALVLNVAQSAFNSSQELVQVAVSLLDLEPDVLVLVDGRNDFYFATRSDWQPHITYRMTRFTDWYERARQRAVREVSFKSDVMDDLRNALKMSRLLQTTYGAVLQWQQARRNEMRQEHDAAAHVRRAVLIYRENIRRMAALLATRQCRFYVLMQPSIFDTRKRLSDHETAVAEALASGALFYEQGAVHHYPLFAASADDALHILAAQQGFVYQNCRRVYDHLGSDTEVFVDDAHLTPEGQAVLAKMVFQTIESALSKGIPGLNAL